MYMIHVTVTHECCSVMYVLYMLLERPFPLLKTVIFTCHSMTSVHDHKQNVRELRNTE